ncbi:uncharacterized protein LOC118266696 [Spodoptera frugiperda]|uniref:Uncharacterized protein LOC118266696 n=1 Tax=Spodoptera frugiperda TaxID=7108 RepID=A0A9R0EIH2_SPOFR|nr:uncharacterized protein LOC118266696 [Spodoptera frugiperda]
MDTTTSIKPKSMAELLPGLSGILSKDSMQTLTAKKQPRQTMVQTRTAEKVVKPLTIAEMRADILSLRVQSPRRPAQGATSARKKNWNSSVKVDKTISHTANGKMKLNPVRKVLNFQPKPKPVMSNTNTRVTMAPEAPKFPKPEYRPKKSMYLLQARNNVRISGINNISETPVITKPPVSRLTLANKENISHQPSIKKFVPPKPLIRKQIIPTIPDTPMSNESWKSSCDASFLQKEKEINDAEAKAKAITEEPTLENIAAVTPPVSTPFKEYRNVQEYFNHSSELESSAVYHDNTIMSFDKPSESKENTKREESVIVSLCDLLNKASVTTTGKMSTELEDLLQIEKQTEHNLKMIDNSIAALNKIKESQLTSLKYVRKLINDKKPQENGDKTLTDTKETSEALVTVKNEKSSPEHKPVVSKPCSVIKSCSKSPSYKIPKKNLCLRKKVFCKSMPNVSNETVTPVKSDMGNRALSMYMKMKEHMNFLNTPVAKRDYHVPDTPAVTSHNLQKQLDKLYDEN